PTFTLNSYKVITLDEMAGNPYSASAIVDLTVDGRSEITAGNGIGPVDALDCAFRRAMAHFYPETLAVTLEDYKVRVIDSGEGTASKVRVFIEFAGNGKRFGTVGLSGDIIQASWAALVDAYEYWIMKSGLHGGAK
ncbi:MAG: citramalate synthase, partial [Clostridia bacterium]|nr:citramalate synthase [Clostridia bacterium]